MKKKSKLRPILKTGYSGTVQEISCIAQERSYLDMTDTLEAHNTKMVHQINLIWEKIRIALTVKF